MRIPLTLIREQADKVADTRSCGPCTACCVLPRIYEQEGFPDGKKGYEPCDRLCSKHVGTGCGIYDTRPDLCRDYTCLWRAGIIEGDERRRPDQLGLMVTLDEVRATYGSGTRIAFEVWELWDGAAVHNPGRYFIESLALKGPVLIRFYGVPCSLNYTGPETLALGVRLSLASLDEPQALAAWCGENYSNGQLDPGPNGEGFESALRDLNDLKLGTPVARHFKPPTR